MAQDQFIYFYMVPFSFIWGFATAYSLSQLLSLRPPTPVATLLPGCERCPISSLQARDSASCQRGSLARSCPPTASGLTGGTTYRQTNKARLFQAGQPAFPSLRVNLQPCGAGLGSCKGSALLAGATRPAVRMVAGSAHHQPGEDSQQPGRDRAGPPLRCPEQSCPQPPPPPCFPRPPKSLLCIWGGNCVLAKHKK